MFSRRSVASVIEGFRRVYGKNPNAVVSAPGRLDFLNTHQDYKGLPVVGIGIDLRCFVAISKRSDTTVKVFTENLAVEGLEHEDSFSALEPELREGKWFGNYVRSVFRAFINRFGKAVGLDIYIASDVPIAAGLASSAALEVAIVKALSYAMNMDLDPYAIAELAFEAEHDIMRIPCGRLDQYSSAFGGIVWIETRPPFRVEKISFERGVFVVLDSGIRHSTADIHPHRQREIEEGLRKLLSMDIPAELRAKLGYRYWEPKWAELTEEELVPYLDRLDEVSRNRILFTIRMHRSTLLALDAMKGRVPSTEEVVRTIGKAPRNTGDLVLSIVGEVMNFQHELLRDLYDVSLPQLERIREAALAAGALGCKLSGAGLGGALIALCRTEEEAKRVLEAGLRAGAIRGWIVRYDDGVRTDYVNV